MIGINYILHRWTPKVSITMLGGDYLWKKKKKRFHVYRHFGLRNKRNCVNFKWEKTDVDVPCVDLDPIASFCYIWCSLSLFVSNVTFSLVLCFSYTWPPPFPLQRRKSSTSSVPELPPGDRATALMAPTPQLPPRVLDYKKPHSFKVGFAACWCPPVHANLPSLAVAPHPVHVLGNC